MTKLIVATALLFAAAPFAATAQDTPTPAPAAAPAATPTPAAPPTPAPPEQAAPASSNPLDQLLVAAKPMTQDAKTAPSRLTGAVTKDCTTVLSLEGGGKMTIDLKKMQGMAVNTNLMVSGGGAHGVQMEFDSKDGAKQAAAAEKAMGDLNDKCGG